MRLVGLRLIVGCEPCAFPFPLLGLAKSRSAGEEVPALPASPHPVSRGMQRTISRRPIDLIHRELHVMVVPQSPFCFDQDSVLAVGRDADPADRDNRQVSNRGARTNG